MGVKNDASNNEAEYEALVAGLRIAEQMGVKNQIAKVDSCLVANQINGLYEAKEQSMTQYLEKYKTLIDGFKKISIEHVPRSENKKADALIKIASTSFAHLTKQVLVETLKRKSIEEREILAILEEEEYCWMTSLVEYLTKEYVVKEIHEGSCSMHSGPRSMVEKAIRSGYYWPTMHKDARNIIRACNNCQTHRPVFRNLQQKLTPITSPWPFYKWGIDISGPFPEAQGKVKFLIVAIDYFTKWIEAKPVETITGIQFKKFIWDNIVCRFRILGEIISDNGKQFRDNLFKDWCEKLKIKQSLGEGIKDRLGEDNRNWVEEVPYVLWAHRTVIKTSNKDTLFFLTYGLLLNLDILKERREKAAVREARCKAKMEKYYNAKVRNTGFRLGDFVYHSNESSHVKESEKLGPKWEGPHEEVEALGKGAYKLRNKSGYVLSRKWNVQDLKKCYL
nr:reverse transcriptase domain-containing protein [Tanacetum cinerariifolium]